MKRAYLIAEAGVNHEGSLPTLAKMVAKAASVGCDAIKVQVYDPERLVTAQAPAYWNETATQRQAFQRVPRLTRHAYTQAAAECDKHDIDFIATPFHAEDIGWLAPLVTGFKIASADITNLPLLDAVAATGKPVFLSTGASDLPEVVAAASRFKPRLLTVLHCTLSYPTWPHDVNLSAIADFKSLCFLNLGYSDHTLPEYSTEVIAAAYLLGATVIEKHFTLDHGLSGNDHYHAFEPEEFRLLRRRLDWLQQVVGNAGKRVLECERPARREARRSLTSRWPIRAGTTITEQMVCLKRPGTGLTMFKPGMVALTDIPADTTLTTSLVG